MTNDVEIPGVYFLQTDGNLRLVHAYTDDDYELSDIVELFCLGKFEPDDANGEPELSLRRADLRKLKVQADAESFDHAEGFIEMCLDIYRFGNQSPDDPLLFVSVD